MRNSNARQKLAEAEPSQVHTLDPRKAARFNARTMLIPSPSDLCAAIEQIPFGTSKTMAQLRAELALAAGADITCPRAATVCWLIAAEVAEMDRAEDVSPITPWWRVSKDGKLYAKLPGGLQRHRELRVEEGIFDK